jgi:hypothetical protein
VGKAKPKLVCVVHLYHWPPTQEVQLHHVWPLGMGGPDVLGNKIPVCPTGHRNIHKAMRDLNDNLPLAGTAKERQYAISGFKQWQAAGKPGNPELMGGL